MTKENHNLLMAGLGMVFLVALIIDTFTGQYKPSGAVLLLFGALTAWWLGPIERKLDKVIKLLEARDKDNKGGSDDVQAD